MSWMPATPGLHCSHKHTSHQVLSPAPMTSILNRAIGINNPLLDSLKRRINLWTDSNKFYFGSKREPREKIRNVMKEEHCGRLNQIIND